MDQKIKDLYIRLLDLSNVMRQVDGAGYLDIQENAAAVQHVKVPFWTDCERLAYAVVREGHSLEGVISKVGNDIDRLFAEVRALGMADADPDDGEYLKEALRTKIEKHWNRSPFLRLTLGTLDKHPQLVVIPIIAIMVGLITLTWNLDWLK